MKNRWGDSRTPEIVTVIIPVHNVEASLEQCLASISGQTYPHLEIIVVDDGSTDGSSEICLAWRARDPRVHVVTTENRGSSAARNTGLQLASGAFVTFVDSDDVLQPNMVSVLMYLACEHSAEISICGYSPFSDVPPSRPDQPDHVSVQPALTALREIVCGRPQWEVWGKLYRREVWDGVEFPQGLIHQDLAVIPRVFANASRVAAVATPLYCYRAREGSIMDTVRRRGPSTDLLKVLEGNISFTNSQNLTPGDRDAFLAAYFLQASKQLERMSRHDLLASSSFVRAYEAFARRHLRSVWGCKEISLPYRLLWVVSSLSPGTFSAMLRMAHTAKRLGWPRLTRSGGNAHGSAP